MAQAASDNDPLLGTAMRSMGGGLSSLEQSRSWDVRSRRWGVRRGFARRDGLQVGVDLVEGDAAGEHEHLEVVEQLADLLGGAVGALVFGGHPHLGGLFDDLLADGVDAGLHEFDRTGPGGGRGDLLGQLGVQLLEALSAHCSPSPLSVSAVATALSAASRPLSSAEPGSPARSSACWSVSQVSTPNPIGMPDSTATLVRPSVAARQT